jgi:hypothetical protein
VSHIREEHRHQLSFPLDQSAIAKDLIRQEFRRVGLGLGIIDRKNLFELA